LDDLAARLKRDLQHEVDKLIADAPARATADQLKLMLLGRLVGQVVARSVDELMGQAFSPKNLASDDAAALGQKLRRVVQGAMSGDGPRLLGEVTAEGIAGARLTVGLLATASHDHYLLVLARALDELRYGQLHPWLRTPDLSVHPPGRAKTTLLAREVPSAVIEYLHASGAYETKTAAKHAVLERLGIAEDTLSDWLKQQRRLRRFDFEVTRRTYRFVGEDVRERRTRAIRDAEAAKFVSERDHLFGLPAVDRMAKALEQIGADRGKKGRVDS
jgi:hypothetical protein